MLAVCAIVGCVEETADGDMRTSWTIGLEEPGLSSCETAGIATVEISLASDEHDATESASCHAGSRTFRAIPVTSYEVTVSGLDASGCAIYGGSASGARPSRDGVPAEVEVVMQRLPAAGTVEVEWRFADGRMCGAHGVESVDLVVMSDDVEHVHSTLPCDEGQTQLVDVPAGSLDVRLEAEDAEGLLCHVENDVDLAPCGVVDVEAVLEPCW
jgi:hypothetical protein